MSELRQIAPNELKPNPHQVRTLQKQYLSILKRSIAQLGAMKPIIVDETLTVLANDAERLAAIQLKKSEVDVYVIGGLSAAKKRAFALAAEKIPELGGWDRSATAKEVSEVRGLLAAEGIEVEITGFSTVEVDQMMIDLEEVSKEPSDDISHDMISEQTVSNGGDLWALGRHRLLCGDAGDAPAMNRIMAGRKADMAFLDPPYNRGSRSIGGRGAVRHADFAMASGELSHVELEALAREWMQTAAAVSREGAVHFICADWRCIPEFARAGRTVYGPMLNLIVWNKTNPGQGSFYRNQHELIAVFRTGNTQHLNNVQLGIFGRPRSNVWTYPGSSGFRPGRMQDLKAHPTVKPTALICDAMRDCTRRDNIVLDSFCGSGSTILAAERVGRIAYAVEIEPRFVDVAIRRWQQFTRKDAVHEASGKTFQELEDTRKRRVKPRVRLLSRSGEPNHTPRVRLEVREHG